MNDFDQAYNMLNNAQRRAVDAIEGPVMVVAGPGTGKTQILTLRIANILRLTDTEPESILALTFTEAAVANMRKRLAGLIGSAAYRVKIATFHGFANDQIQGYPEFFPGIIGAASMTEVDQLGFVREVILDAELDVLKPFGDTFLYVRPIMSAIGTLKREGVTPTRFQEMVAKEQEAFGSIEDLFYEKGAHTGKMKGKYQALQKKLAKNAELARVYAAYQEHIRAAKKYDFSDMIIELVQALANDQELLLTLQEQYQYFLVDEHQDTNNAQNQLLELLANFHESPNLFVVGDEKQSIFRFQGASVENFFYFRDRYPDAQLVALTDNYRSTQAVLDSGESLIAGSEPLVAQAGGAGTPIEVVSYPSRADEVAGVVERIKAASEKGAPLSDIAVLYRTNRDSFDIADMLDRHGIAYRIESDQDLFADPAITHVIAFLRAVAFFGDDEAVAPFLFSPYSNLDVYDATRIIRGASHKRKHTLFDCLRDPAKMLPNIAFVNPGALTELYANLESWVEYSHQHTLPDVVEYLWRSSGVVSHALGSNEPTQALGLLDAVFAHVKEFALGNPEATVRDFIEYIDMMREHGMMTKRPQDISREAVRLMTAHRSKGLEFEHVFIIHAIDGHWGNRKKRELLPLLDAVFVRGETRDLEGAEAHDDERRLLYVALTRAKQSVTLSYFEIGHDGREAVPSQFIGEIDQALLAHSQEKKSTTSLLTQPKALGSQTTTKEHVRAFVHDTFFRQGLSVSALNNFLADPWLYFFRNLVRLPSAQNKHQIYGIAVHDVVSQLFDARNAGEDWSREQLLRAFETAIASYEHVLGNDFSDTLDKGYVSLGGWFDTYYESFAPRTLNEFRVNGVLVELPGSETPIRLTGVLDKLEIADNGQDVVVVDYKTGKPKTRNDIMGNTKSSNGNYYRQLVFYKLLLDNFAEGRYRMTAGEIDFVEPDTKGAFRKESFAIEQQEVSELIETIQNMAQSVLDLEFWDTDPDSSVNEYADLVNMLR